MLYIIIIQPNSFLSPKIHESQLCLQLPNGKSLSKTHKLRTMLGPQKIAQFLPQLATWRVVQFFWGHSIVLNYITHS